MICPFCGSKNIEVNCHDPSYNLRHPDRLKRYRKCKDCGRGFSTVESYLRDYKPKTQAFIKELKK